MQNFVLKVVRLNIQEQKQIYEELDKRNYPRVELEREIAFLDIVNSPLFMVTKEFANLIRIYYPAMKFKYMVLFDEKIGGQHPIRYPICQRLNAWMRAVN